MADENQNQGPGQPTKYDKTMPDRVGLFLMKRQQEGNLPTHAGLAVFLGVCKATIENWAKQHSEFLASLGILNATQEDILITRGLKSEYNSTITKLILSSNHGYCERTDTTSAGEKIEPATVSFLDALKQPGDPDEVKIDET